MHYSLHVRTCPAKVGDKLTTRYFGSGTSGFAASEDVNVAVCLSPGTELSFAKEVRRESVWWPFTKIKHKTAIFRQVNKHTPSTHHDALEFPDGQIVLLTFLQQANKPRFFSFQHRLTPKLSNGWSLQIGS